MITPSSLAPEKLIARNAVSEQFFLLTDLFDAFHEHAITYCHWKSNEHLGAAMTGNTDLDLFFDESQKEAVKKLMVQHGFKEFKAAPQKRYDGIEDFLGLDYATGKIYHLHTHFKLTLGENYIKSYQLNIENLVLQSRVFNEEYQVYTTHPALELILLFIRSSFKIRNRDKIKILLGKGLHCTASSVVEYKWLRARCVDEMVDYFLRQIFTSHEAVLKIINGGFNKRQLLALSKIVKAEFNSQRTINPVVALYKRWNREFTLKFLRKYSKLTSQPVVVKRTNPLHGLSVAFIGPDGTGKSTIIKSLEQGFKTKLDVYSIYFGKGGGRMSWYRKLLTMIRYRKLVKNGDERSAKVKSITGNSEKKVAKKKPGKIARLFSIAEALMVQNEKLVNYKLLRKASAKGIMVICDRYPQSQFTGFNDGPSLKHLNVSNSVLKGLAEKEENAYRFLQNNPPDIVFKLVADIDVIAARKPGETSFDTLRKKKAAFEQVNYPAPCKTIEINANQPLNQVLSSIRRKIWEEIQ